ncbi:hypothetical protein PHMEG_00034688 [Phytophthora megakarya]|uniref:Integrase catalytic domain-containing protein n=1 Tax=Phytophthora megakarya TaxID=4795 RepID=A0A225UQG0_9STRA|nr:hypothetical protein PHMEG_00034688 [Phytophthora megakarya]
MEYRYEVEHIDGEANVWADMISRWAGNHDPTVHLNAMTLRKRSPAELRPDIQPRRKRTRCRRKKTLVDDQQLLPQLLRPLDDPDFVWPSASVIRDTQQLHADCRPQVAVGDEENGWFIEDKVWIPRKAGDLVQRLLVVAHCGPQGHRGRDAMMESVGRHFNVHHLRARIENFLASCLMCKHVKGGKTIQRPWGPTFRTNERNGALHFDFLTLGESFSGDSYLLVLKDEATHFTELVPCSAPTSTVVVESILAWYSRFGVAPVWISDQGSHFKAEIVGELCRRLKARHEFTVVYSPWINGSVERANRDIMQVLRVMCLEYKVDTHDWTFFVPMLQASLNHTPVPSLGNAAPVELFCGLPLPSPLNLCMDAKQKIIMELPEQPEAIQTWLGKLRHSIHELHKPMIRERAQQTVRNKRMQKYARRPNFSVGDYVLRSRVDQKHHDKLLVTWVGPYQITRADPHSFQVRHLVTGALTDVHLSRLKFYADISLSITEELRDHVAAQGIVLSVGELKDSRWNEDTDDYEVLIGWKGLEPIEDSWEPLL